MTIEDTGGSTPTPHGGTARDLERYGALFAKRTALMKSSAMRDLMAITERPEVISLAGGLPDVSSFPPAMLERVTYEIGRQSARALQYGPTEGMASVHDAIVQVMAEEGTYVDNGEILVTTGGQQAIDLCCKILLDPGDVIIAEAPTYPGAVPTFQAYEADVRQVEMDDDGLRIDLLEELLAELDAEGKRPKFIYTIPTFQNPAGVTMSLERRKRLVEIAAERELLIVEDSPYSLLRYEGEPLPTLRTLDGGRYVIYLGTFSKILAAGLRVGWMIAPGPLMQKFTIGKAGSDLNSSSVSQIVVEACLADLDEWRAYMEQMRGIYRGRRDAMLDSLDANMPQGAHWTHPQGGLFLWATLPEQLDTTDLLARALRSNVAFVPGRGAYVDGRGAHAMRLNFSGVQEAEIREGVRRIGAVVTEQLELYGDVAGTPIDTTPRKPAKRRAAAEPAGAGDARPARTAASDPADGQTGSLVEFPRRRAQGN